MEDAQIIQMYWERCDDAIAETDKKYGAYCHRIAANILQDPRDAEECVSDTYQRAWNTILPQRPNALSAFLGKIIRNLSLDRYRHNHAEKRFDKMEILLSELGDCVPCGDQTQQAFSAALTAQYINDFLEKLPKQKRIVFVLRYWYAQPVREIAKTYGLSESKVTSMLFHLRQGLKTVLEKKGVAV